MAGAGELFQELRMRLSERNERGAFSWHSVHGMRIASGMGLHGIVCGVHYEDFEIGERGTSMGWFSTFSS